MDQIASAVGAEGLEAIRDVQRFIEERAASLEEGWASGYLNVLADDVRRATGGLLPLPIATVIPLRARL